MLITKITTITITFPWLLAETSDNCQQFGVFDADLSDQLIEGVSVAEKVKDSFNSLWDLGLSSDNYIYWTLADIGMLLALVTVIVFTMRWGRELLESGVSSKSFAEIIWPLVVAVLLSNNGHILANFTVAMRDYVHEQEEVIVRRAFLFTFFGESLESAFRQLVGVTTVPLGIGSILAQCTSSENPTYCLSGEPIINKETKEVEDFHPGALNQSICALETYKDSGENPKLKELQEQLIKEQESLRATIEQQFGSSQLKQDRGSKNKNAENSKNTSPIPTLVSKTTEEKKKNTEVQETKPVTAIPPAVYKLMSASEDSGLMQFFMGSGAAFVWLTELALFLTALLGPLAVGLSLLPVGGRAIFAWLTGFLSIAFAKLFYFILTGLSSMIVLDAIKNVSVVDFVDSILIGIFIGALAPLLSLAVCVSGGRAVFQSLSNYMVSAVGGTLYRSRKYQ